MVHSSLCAPNAHTSLAVRRGFNLIAAHTNRDNDTVFPRVAQFAIPPDPMTLTILQWRAVILPWREQNCLRAN